MTAKYFAVAAMGAISVNISITLFSNFSFICAQILRYKAIDSETFIFISFSLGHIGAIFVKFVEWQYFGLESKTLTPTHKKIFDFILFLNKLTEYSCFK